MKKMIDTLKKAAYRVRYAAVLAATTLFMQMTTVTAYANVGSSKLGTGLQKLINDLTSYLMIIAPIAMVVFMIYFFIRKGMADEMDQKKWNSRIITAVISCVGAFLAAAIIQLAKDYFV